MQALLTDDFNPAEEQSAAGKASVALRSDMIRIDPAGQVNGINSLSGTVRTIEYHGAVVRLALEVAGVEEFTITLAEGEYFAAPVHYGDTVHASWNEEAVHLLRH